MSSERLQDGQGYFFELPNFLELEATGGKATIKTGFHDCERKEKGTRVQTTISNIETWYPYLLKTVLDKDIGQERNREFTLSTERASVIGEELHRGDVVFNLICEGCVGPLVKRSLPSGKKDEITLYEFVTEGLNFYPKMGPDELYKYLVYAWDRYLQLRIDSQKPQAIPMLSEIGVVNPLRRMEILRGDELRWMGMALAAEWSCKYYEGNKEEWEYRPDFESVNEVLVVINTDRLQIRSRLDRVTRPRKTKSKLSAQVTDLKTGSNRANSWLEKEVKLRQGQLAWFVASRFVSKHMLGKKWIEHQGEAYVINASAGAKVKEDRSRFFYRWFNRDTGRIEREEVVMDEVATADFYEWLSWYSEQAQIHRRELKKLR